ncbi:putative restriction endonuclease [Pedobacter terrae]|uniref:Putative restriction endonuclease n=1 Tax=Pedobacter terrae TaxID=405671 RepID=A0A1G7Q5H5_9SPHI|nr:hypothetical protein [Pedobacter terrae]SDF93733.1 putative restriction endonuclease [Pedobacter terrae]
MGNFLLVNITWNASKWRDNTYINPRAGHAYARNNVAGEALNFKFNKKGLDTAKFVYGFFRWTAAPIKFQKDGLIIFYTKNTDIKRGQIVGIYGRAELVAPPQERKVSLQDTPYLANIRGEVDYSMLFPIPLDAEVYKERSADRLVGQNGFTYLDQELAERILYDELTALSGAGAAEGDFMKLGAVYEHYTGKQFKPKFVTIDDKEQQSLELLYGQKTKEELLAALAALGAWDHRQVMIKGKNYKRRNSAIAIIKNLGDYRCQICSATIAKKGKKQSIISYCSVLITTRNLILGNWNFTFKRPTVWNLHSTAFGMH